MHAGKPPSDALALSQARRHMMDMTSREKKTHKPQVVRDELSRGSGADAIRNKEEVLFCYQGFFYILKAIYI